MKIEKIISEFSTAGEIEAESKRVTYLCIDFFFVSLGREIRCRNTELDCELLKESTYFFGSFRETHEM